MPEACGYRYFAEDCTGAEQRSNFAAETRYLYIQHTILCENLLVIILLKLTALCLTIMAKDGSTVEEVTLNE